jgi:hypothetical protein
MNPATLQMKLTYLGVQTEPIPTLMLASQPNLSRFAPFRRPAIDYGNDQLPVIYRCSPTAAEFATALRAISTEAAITAGGLATERFLSFSMINVISGTTKGFEAVLNRADTNTLLDKLGGSLRSNRTCAVQLAALRSSAGL